MLVVLPIVDIIKKLQVKEIQSDKELSKLLDDLSYIFDDTDSEHKLTNIETEESFVRCRGELVLRSVKTTCVLFPSEFQIKAYFEKENNFLDMSSATEIYQNSPT